MAVRRRRNRGIRRAVAYLIASLFIPLGLTKAFALGFEVGALGYYGLPPWFVVLLGIYEVLGGVGVLFRPTSFFAATGLCLEMVGAAAAFWLGGTPGLLLLPLVMLVLTGSFAIASWPEVGRALGHAPAT